MGYQEAEEGPRDEGGVTPNSVHDRPEALTGDKPNRSGPQGLSANGHGRSVQTAEENGRSRSQQKRAAEAVHSRKGRRKPFTGKKLKK